MKLTISLATFALVLFLACQCAPSKLKYSTESPFEPLPSLALARQSGIPFADLRDGQHLFQRKCGECHRHRLPDTQEATDWKSIVPHMSAIAGLDPEEEKLLLDYLLASRSATINTQE